MYRLLALSMLRALTRHVCCCQDAESPSLLQTAATSESPVSTNQASVQTELPGLILELKKEAELVLIDYSGNVFFLTPSSSTFQVWSHLGEVFAV